MSNHEHHHDHHCHDENCTCEHCHFESHGVTFHLSMDLHDGAVVASAKGHLQTDHGLLQQTMCLALKRMADRITAEGGIIGHIKSAVEIHSVEGYSITSDTVTMELSPTVQAHITVNAIVFCLETECLEEQMKVCLAEISKANQ